MQTETFTNYFCSSCLGGLQHQINAWLKGSETPPKCLDNLNKASLSNAELFLDFLNMTLDVSGTLRHKHKYEINAELKVIEDPSKSLEHSNKASLDDAELYLN